MMWSTGSLTPKSYEEARKTGVIATGTNPIIPVLGLESPEEEAVEKLADYVIDQLYVLLNIKFGSSMQPESGTDIKIRMDADIDEFVPTWDKIPLEGVTIWRDRLKQNFAAENIWWMQTMTAVQTAITTYAQKAPVSIKPDLRMTGDGFCRAEEGAIRIVRRVSDQMAWKGGTGTLKLIKDPYTVNEKREQYLALMLLARALWRCIPDRMDKENDYKLSTYRHCFRTNDMMAVVNRLLLQFQAAGAPGVTHEYTASAILGGIDATIGLGLSEGDRFLFNTQQSWVDWFTFCVLFGIISQRTKGLIGDIEVRLDKVERMILLPQVIDNFNQVMGMNGHQYDLSGSTTPWVPMARNLLQSLDIPMPMIVAETDLDGEVEQNKYLWIRKPIASFETVEARFGKLGSPLVEALPTKETHKIIRVHYDMQKYTVPRIDHDLNVWSIGYSQILSNGAMPEPQRRFNWLLGLFIAGPSNFTKGYAMAPGMKLFALENVAYYSSSEGTALVAKEGTQNIGEQEPAPNGIPMSTSTLDTSRVIAAKGLAGNTEARLTANTVNTNRVAEKIIVAAEANKE